MRTSFARLLAPLVLALAAGTTLRAEELRADELVERLAAARRSAHAAFIDSDFESNDDQLATLRKDAKRLAGAKVRSGAELLDVDPGLAKDLRALDEESRTNARRDALARIERRLEALEREARRAQEAIEAPVEAPKPGTNQLQPADFQPGGPADSERKAVLSQVLDRPHYKKRTENLEGFGLSEKLDSLQQRLENWWIRLLQPTPAMPRPAWLTSLINFIASIVPTSPWGWLALGLGVIGLIALLVWLKSRRNRKLDDGRPTTLDGGYDGQSLRGAVVPEESYSEDHWRREARLLARQGDHRGAIRALYTGVLLFLQRAGRLKFDKGKTNWEHVRELRRNDRGLAARLEPLTRTFDVAWYGQKPVEPVAFDEFLKDADGFTATASGDASAQAAP